MRVIAVATCALVLAVVAAAEDAHEAAAPRTDNEVDLTDEEKRAWNSLHGGWGKRAWQDLNSAWGKRAWKDLNSAWGKRAWQDLNSAWGKRAWQDLNSAWGKRAWQDLNSAWGKRAWEDLNSAWGKRGWKDLNAAWGKRAWNDLSQASWGKRGWQDLNSAWGKRAPEKWVNFHGSWGKRSGMDMDYSDADTTPEQLMALYQIQMAGEKPELVEVEVPDKKAWSASALHGAWGKRPVKPAQTNSGAYYWKREPGWTNLRGMWGKRSTPWEPQGDDDGSTAQDEA